MFHTRTHFMSGKIRCWCYAGRCLIMQIKYNWCNIKVNVQNFSSKCYLCFFLGKFYYTTNKHQYLWNAVTNISSPYILVSISIYETKSLYILNVFLSILGNKQHFIALLWICFQYFTDPISPGKGWILA